jgi:predicted  nucleic acid-binding Zn-ribbon protein
MQKRRRFNTKKYVSVAALAVLIATICFASGGCGEKMARIEQNQIELQQLFQLNTQLMTDNMKRIENNYSQLHVTVEDVQNGNKKQTNDIIAAIGQEQAALQDTLQIHHQRLNNSIVGLERNQSVLQGGIEGLNTSVSQVNESTVDHEKNLMQLQQSLQNNNKEMANIMDVIGQRQLRSEERIQGNIQSIVDTLKDVQQSQAAVQEQITSMQNRSEQNNSKIIAALEQMKATLSQLRAQINSLSPPKNASSSEINK